MKRNSLTLRKDHAILDSTFYLQYFNFLQYVTIFDFSHERKNLLMLQISH